MKKGSNFEKFYKGREKTGAAKKEEFRQDKKKEKKEREEKIILAKREKRAKTNAARSGEPPKYNLEPPGNKFQKKQRDDREVPPYRRENTPFKKDKPAYGKDKPAYRKDDTPRSVSGGNNKRIELTPKKSNNRTTKPEKWDGPGPNKDRSDRPSKGDNARLHNPANSRQFKSREERPYSDNKPSPYKSDSRKPYKTDDSKPYSAEGRKPFKTDSSKSYSPEGRKPSNSERPKPFRKDDSKPYRTDNPRSFSSEGRKPYDPGAAKPFRKEEPRPNKADGPKPVLQKKELPKKVGHKDQAGANLRQESPVKAPINRQHLEEELMPLNKYIAHSGVCSRRDAVDLIKAGKVKVNGELVLEPGHKVAISDDVKVAGRKLDPVKDFVYILLNKPKDYITTTDDPQERKTVLDLLKGAPEVRIYPVGRLDRNTSGVLLLTNDGDLAQKLTHPSNEIKKVYAVTLDKALTKHHFEEILKGVPLEDGIAHVDSIAFPDPQDLTQVGVELHSGRNRVVRRIFEHFGYDIKALDRVTFAGLTKKNITRGKWRFLVEKEVRDLKFFKKGRK